MVNVHAAVDSFDGGTGFGRSVRVGSLKRCSGRVTSLHLN